MLVTKWLFNIRPTHPTIGMIELRLNPPHSEEFHATIQGAFFNCSHPKISKRQPVSKLRPKKLEYPNCSHPFNTSKYRQVHIFQVTDHACEGTG